jgi:hypothetical protein
MSEAKDSKNFGADPRQGHVIAATTAGPGKYVHSETWRRYGVDPAVAGIVGQKVAKIRRRRRLMVTTAIEIGRELIELKEELLPHGMFKPFVINEFLFSIRTAELLMNCVGLANENPDLVEKFQLTALYVLAAPGTPTDVRGRVLTEMREGLPCPSAAAIRKEARDAGARGCEVRNVELSAAAKELSMLLIENMPREKLCTTARLLRALDRSEVSRMASKIGFQGLRSAQLYNFDES